MTVSTHAEVVSVCLQQHIPCQRRLDLENPNFECLWLWLRPIRLPRPPLGNAVCVVCNPPDRSAHEKRERDLRQYIRVRDTRIVVSLFLEILTILTI